MLDQIFAEMNSSYRKGVFSEKTSFYFSVGDIKRTVVFDADSFSVATGKTVENADCVCVSNEELFLKIWNDGYKPGLKDFMTGAIKSNAPHLLQQFMTAFGK